MVYTHLKLLACQLLCCSEHMLKELTCTAHVPCAGTARQFAQDVKELQL